MDSSEVRRPALRIEVAHLRNAATAADYGSFRKAAEVLGIRQSTLSRSIRQLEHAASVSIFNRSTGGVVLTASGRRIVRTARVVLEQIDSLSLAGANADERVARLSVGFCTSLSVGGLRSAIVDFRRKFPTVLVKTLERSRSRLAIALRNGTLDVIISTGTLPSIQCKSQPLWSERILVALPEDHDLAKRDIIYWTDLRGQKLLMSRYDPYWEFEHLLVSKLMAIDDRPIIEHHDVSRSILKSLVSMRFGLGLMLESDIGVGVPAVVYRELQDGLGPARIGFSAFWDESNHSPVSEDFIALLRERYPLLS